METRRTLGNDWVVRHDNRLYQVDKQRQNNALAKSKVTVCEWEDGTMEIHYRGQKQSWHEIKERPRQPKAAASNRKPSTKPTVPQPNHPWRRSYQDMHAQGSPRAAAGAGTRISVASASATP